METEEERRTRLENDAAFLKSWQLPYFLECFSHPNCIRPLKVFAQQSGLNVYCVRPRIVFARCSKRCSRAIVIGKDNPLSGKISSIEKCDTMVKCIWIVGKKWQKKLQCNRNGRRRRN